MMFKYHIITITICIILCIVGVKMRNMPKMELEDDVTALYDLYDVVTPHIIFEDVGFDPDYDNRGIFIKGYMYPK